MCWTAHSPLTAVIARSAGDDTVFVTVVLNNSAINAAWKRSITRQPEQDACESHFA
ncbi:LEA14-like dessication related protein [Bradyrhizobium sp. USDA 4369]